MKKIFITFLAVSLLVLTVNGCSRLKKKEAVPPAKEGTGVGETAPTEPAE